MKLLRKFIYLLSISYTFCGTMFLSTSIDEFSEGEGFIAEYISKETYSLGYYDTVWEKRKVKNSIGLGIDAMANKNFNIIAFYSMFNYKFSKTFFSTIYVGLDFYNHEYKLNNEHLYAPDSKGGSMYGLGFTYILNDKFPLSLNYKIYNASEVQSDNWMDLVYERTSFSLGYKF